MSKSTFTKAYEMIKVSNAILGKAGNKMVRSSFHTAKKIALLYKDASYATLTIGKKAVQESFKLAVDNQKEIIQTSGEAIKETAKSLRKSEVKVAPKTKRKPGRKKKKADITIDDLLPEEN